MSERGPSDDSAWAPPAPSTVAPAPAATPTDSLMPGYEDLGIVARGADSVVHRARQRALGRDVAVKVLLVGDEQTAARFQRELEITVGLGRQHPHIVTVLDTGLTAAGQPCIVMEFVERGSVQDVLREKGPLAVGEVLRVGRVVADALAFAHAHGVLHRDVKPQNILVLPTSYVLADFGIARLADSSHTASVEQFSYRHAAPQVLDGAPPSAADDIWSLGSTLFTLLDGRPPFASDDPADDTALAYLRRARTEAPRRLRRPDVPEDLAAVIERCLQRDPADRYATALEVHQALARAEARAEHWSPETDDAATTDLPAPGVGLAASPEPELPLSSEPEATEPPAEPEVTEPPALPAPAPVVDEVATPGSAWAPDPAPAPTPEPVAAPARSALAHDPTLAARPSVDETPTGLADAPAPLEDADDEPTGLDRKVLGRRVLAGLLLGAAVGVGFGWWQMGHRTPTATPTPKDSGPVPTLSLTGTARPTPVVPVSDPSIAPFVTSAVGHGTSVDLAWRDPTSGRATFFVTWSNATPQPLAVAQFGPGTTRGTVEGVDPKATRVCYVVAAVVGTKTGVSNEVCVDPSP